MKNKIALDSLVALSIQLLDDNQTNTEDLDKMTRHLQYEINEHLGTNDVRLKSDNVPHKGKSAPEGITFGVILLTVLPEALPALINFIHEITTRPGYRPIKIKVQEENRIIEAEFDPRTTSKDKVAAFIRECQSINRENPEN